MQFSAVAEIVRVLMARRRGPKVEAKVRQRVLNGRCLWIDPLTGDQCEETEYSCGLCQRHKNKVNYALAVKEREDGVEGRVELQDRLWRRGLILLPNEKGKIKRDASMSV